MGESSYDEYDRRSMPPSRLFGLLLRIKKSVGDETFQDALSTHTVHPPTPPPRTRRGL